MDFIEFLINLMQDPVAYSVVFFIYTILAAVILPIPVELGLFNPYISPVILVIILAAGKGVGAGIVYYIGIGVRGIAKKTNFSSKLLDTILGALERFVKKFSYLGLFIIMSIPLMLDSVTLYLFSLCNPDEGKTHFLRLNNFVLINIAAGAVRGSIVLIIFYLIGLKLV